MDGREVAKHVPPWDLCGTEDAELETHGQDWQPEEDLGAWEAPIGVTGRPKNQDSPTRLSNYGCQVCPGTGVGWFMCWPWDCGDCHGRGLVAPWAGLSRTE